MRKTAPSEHPSDAAGAGRVAIVAGGGRLPVELAKGLQARGETPFVVLLDGEVEEMEAFARLPQMTIGLEQAGAVMPRLKQEGVRRLVLAGTVKRRARLANMRPFLPLLPVIGRLAAALARGDDNLLRVIVTYVERHGIKVVGAHQLMPDLLVPEGVHTRHKPATGDRKDIDAAFAAAKAIGALDIGQAAVSIGGRAIALEGIEGTDGLLERVAQLRGHGRLAGRKGGVLVKCAKPGQELRADLPTIGVNTVEGAHAAGLKGIAVEAEASLAMGFGDMVAKADELGLFIVGLPAGGGT